MVLAGKILRASGWSTASGWPTCASLRKNRGIEEINPRVENMAASVCEKIRRTIYRTYATTPPPPIATFHCMINVPLQQTVSRRNAGSWMKPEVKLTLNNRLNRFRSLLRFNCRIAISKRSRLERRIASNWRHRRWPRPSRMRPK